MKEYFRFQRSWTVTSDLLHRSLVIKTSSQFLSVLRHLHDANTHLTSARLKTSPILLLGLQSVSKSDSKSIARQLTFLLIFFLIPDHCLTKLVRVVIGTSATRGQQFEIEIHHSANPYHFFSVVYVSKIFSVVIFF